MSSVERLIAANARMRNSASGTSGSGRRVIRSGNATSPTSPTASAIHATGSAHCRSWPRIAPNASPPTATTATTAPSQSNRPDDASSRLSAMNRVVAQIAAAINGRLIRNAMRQLIASMRIPPTTGPRTSVPEVAAAQIPKARPRAAPSNVAVMIEREAGTSSAPATPWRTLAAASSSRVGARPHRTDVIPNPHRPMRKTRRRP